MATIQLISPSSSFNPGQTIIESTVSSSAAVVEDISIRVNNYPLTTTVTGSLPLLTAKTTCLLKQNQLVSITVSCKEDGRSISKTFRCLVNKTTRTQKRTHRAASQNLLLSYFGQWTKAVQREDSLMRSVLNTSGLAIDDITSALRLNNKGLSLNLLDTEAPYRLGEVDISSLLNTDGWASDLLSEYSVFGEKGINLRQIEMVTTANDLLSGMPTDVSLSEVGTTYDVLFNAPDINYKVRWPGFEVPLPGHIYVQALPVAFYVDSRTGDYLSLRLTGLGEAGEPQSEDVPVASYGVKQTAKRWSFVETVEVTRAPLCQIDVTIFNLKPANEMSVIAEKNLAQQDEFMMGWVSTVGGVSYFHKLYRPYGTQTDTSNRPGYTEASRHILLDMDDKPISISDFAIDEYLMYGVVDNTLYVWGWRSQQITRRNSPPEPDNKVINIVVTPDFTTTVKEVEGEKIPTLYFNLGIDFVQDNQDEIDVATFHVVRETPDGVMSSEIAYDPATLYEIAGTDDTYVECYYQYYNADGTLLSGVSRTPLPIRVLKPIAQYVLPVEVDRIQVSLNRDIMLTGEKTYRLEREYDYGLIDIEKKKLYTREIYDGVRAER